MKDETHFVRANTPQEFFNQIEKVKEERRKKEEQEELGRQINQALRIKEVTDQIEETRERLNRRKDS